MQKYQLPIPTAKPKGQKAKILKHYESFAVVSTSGTYQKRKQQRKQQRWKVKMLKHYESFAEVSTSTLYKKTAKMVLVTCNPMYSELARGGCKRIP